MECIQYNTHTVTHVYIQQYISYLWSVFNITHTQSHTHTFNNTHISMECIQYNTHTVTDAYIQQYIHIYGVYSI